MSDKANYFKLGLFIITAFSLAVLALALLGAGDFLKKEFLVETCFDESVQGLDVGSSVKYRGIEIGKVKAITSAASVYQVDSHYVLVILALSEDISLGLPGVSSEETLARAVKGGLTVRLAFQGLTGAAYLETDFTDPQSHDPLPLAWIPKYHYIPSEPNTITKLGESLDKIMKNLEKIDIQGIIEHLDALFSLMHTKLDDVNIKELSSQAEGFLKEVRETNRKLDRLMGSEKTKLLLTDARAAVSGVRRIVHDAEQPLKDGLAGFKAASLKTVRLAESIEKSAGPAIDSLASELKITIGTISDISRALEGMVWLNADRVNAIMENLTVTSENLKQMSRDLKRYPGKLLFERPPGEKTEAKQ